MEESTIGPITSREEPKGNNGKKTNMIDFSNKTIDTTVEPNNDVEPLDTFVYADLNENTVNTRVRKNKRKYPFVEDLDTIITKKMNIENNENLEEDDELIFLPSPMKNTCTMSTKIIFTDKKKITLDIKKVENKFKAYYKECKLQIEELEKYYRENKEIIKEMFIENDTSLFVTEVDSKEEEEKMEKKKKILKNIMNMRLEYILIEMIMYIMKYFVYFIKERNNRLCLIESEDKLELYNYERVIEKLVSLKISNYRKVKSSIEEKGIYTEVSELHTFQKNPKHGERSFLHMYTLLCLVKEMKQRIMGRDELEQIKKKEISCLEELYRQETLKNNSLHTLHSFKNTIQAITSKYITHNPTLPKYLSILYYKLYSYQMSLEANVNNFRNSKKGFHFCVNPEDSSIYENLFANVTFDIVIKDRKKEKNALLNEENSSDPFVKIVINPSEHFDKSILPDSSSVKYLMNVSMEISFLENINCLVAKVNSVNDLSICNGIQLLSQIYSTEDTVMNFCKDPTTNISFTEYGYPFVWLNALGENEDLCKAKLENTNIIEPMYKWHVQHSLNLSILFYKIYTRIVFRIWDLWQIQHYKSYANVFPSFKNNTHMEILKEIQSNALQQISSFEIITREMYMKESQQVNLNSGNEDLFVCISINLNERIVKSFVIFRLNGQEPSFKILVIKDASTNVMNKLEHLINKEIVTKYMKDGNMFRQILFTIQLGKLREGIAKYNKEYTQNPLLNGDEHINY